MRRLIPVCCLALAACSPAFTPLGGGADAGDDAASSVDSDPVDSPVDVSADSRSPDGGSPIGDMGTGFVDARVDTSVADAAVDVSAILDHGAPADGAPLDLGAAATDGAIVDAGTVDSGALDAGPADSGALDAGTADSGALDTGRPDTGAADTGRPDTGTPDTGTVVGGSDVTPVDAAPTDAGVADGGAGSGWISERVSPLVGPAEDGAIAVDAAGRDHLCFRDYVYRDVRYATNASGAWVSESIERGEDWFADTGVGCDIQMGPGGQPHVVYFDRVTRALRHATKSGGRWLFDTVAADVDGLVSSPLVARPRALFDGTGVLTVVWGDAAGLHAARSSAGAWLASSIEGPSAATIAFGLTRDRSGRALIGHLPPGGAVTLTTFDGAAWRSATPALPVVGTARPNRVLGVFYSSTGETHILTNGVHYLYNGDSWETHELQNVDREYAIGPDGVIYSSVLGAGRTSQGRWDGTRWAGVTLSSTLSFPRGRLVIAPDGSQHMLAWNSSTQPADASVLRPTGTALGTPELVQAAMRSYFAGAAINDAGREYVGVSQEQGSGATSRATVLARDAAVTTALPLPTWLSYGRVLLGRDSSVRFGDSQSVRQTGSSWVLEPFALPQAVDEMGIPTWCENGRASRYSGGMFTIYDLVSPAEVRSCHVVSGAGNATVVVTATNTTSTLVSRWNGMRFATTNYPVFLSDPTVALTTDGVVYTASLTRPSGRTLVQLSRLTGGTVTTQNLDGFSEIGNTHLVRLDRGNTPAVLMIAPHNATYAYLDGGVWRYSVIVSDPAGISSGGTLAFDPSNRPFIYLSSRGFIRRFTRP
jgi:hypothetical protein